MDQALQQATEHMEKAVEVLRKELAAVRAGRANPALLERVQVNYYGVPTPVNQVATVSVPEPRLLVIQPWERNMVPEIERAILKSDLGLNPSSDGTVIRLAIPQLTQERRQELVKQVHKKAEECRVAIRNVRRDANENLKKREKAGEISEDEAKRLQNEVQKLTDRFIEQVDRILAAKEEEIREG